MADTSTYVPKPKISVTVSPLTPDDYATVSRLQIASFDAASSMISLRMNPPERRPALEQRIIDGAKQLAETVKIGHATFLKATLQDGTIAGYGVWKGPEDPIRPPRQPKTDQELQAEEAWFEKMGFDNKFATAFFEALNSHREELAAGEKHWYLELLVVDPEHQGKGVGQALVQWGIDRADAASPPLEALVHASPMGARVYKKKGFENVGIQDLVWEGQTLHLQGMRRSAQL